MPHLRYRYASLVDVPELGRHIQAAYRGEVSRLGWTTEADLLDGQRTDEAELASLVRAFPERRLLLACHDQLLVGSLLLARVAGAVEVGMIAVRPALQARGIGRALLAEAERLARVELCATRMRMAVIAQRVELLAWYGRRGYVATQERAPFPYGQPRFGLPRRPDLYFALLEKRLGGSAEAGEVPTR